MDVDNSEDDGTEAEQLESFVDEAQQWIKTSLKTLKLRPLPQSTQNVLSHVLPLHFVIIRLIGHRFQRRTRGRHYCRA